MMGTFRRCYTKVINKQTHTSAEHSPKSPAALMPLASSPAFLQAYTHRLSILELIWRACCKPPNVTGILGRCYPGIINKRRHTSTEHSPMHRAVLVLPSSRPLLATAQAINPGHLNIELVSRVHKPPDPMAQRLLPKAINGTQKG
jgi:hypothetical protein